jgi:hypothetical protein
MDLNDVRIWTGFYWLRIGASGGPFEFHKFLGIYRLAERLLASQEGLNSVELVLQ